jgi:hypothetical protein
MKVTKLKKSEELTPYAKEEVREAASKEELHEVLFSLDHFLNAIGKIRQDVFISLQNKMAKSEQLSLDFGSYTYEIKNEVKHKFNNDFSSIEDEAKFLEDHGFASLVTRTEETVNTVKVNRNQVKKAFNKNMFPEVIASHYSNSEETKLSLRPPVKINKKEEE